MKSIDKLRKTLKDCTKEAGVEPNKFDTYWITANACDHLIDEIEAEIADNYMRLPVDADGVPIRVGDSVVAEEPFRPNIGEKPAEVVCMLINSDGWSIGDCDPCGHWFHPATLEHVKPRTLEDVLVEYAETIDVASWKKAHDSRSLTIGEWEEIIRSEAEKYADEIRELLGFEIDDPDTIRNELEDNGLLGGDAS